MPNINAHLKDYRIFRKITQGQLAESIGKSKNVISNWESGLNKPDIESVEKICTILRITPNQIFGWESLPEFENQKKLLNELKRKKEKLQTEIKQTQQELHELEKKYYTILSTNPED